MGVIYSSMSALDGIQGLKSTCFLSPPITLKSKMLRQSCSQQRIVILASHGFFQPHHNVTLRQVKPRPCLKIVTHHGGASSRLWHRVPQLEMILVSVLNPFYISAQGVPKNVEGGSLAKKGLSTKSLYLGSFNTYYIICKKC
jgi:hypothetical protein